MITSKREKRLMSNLKMNSIRLKESGQIPKSLYDEILYLNFSSDIEYVKFLMELSEHFMRIKGYYFKYPDLDYECMKAIEKYHNR
jgi:hypothetical protein